MRGVLARIQSGEYAKEFVLENRAGAPTLLSRRRMTASCDREGRARLARNDAVDQEEPPCRHFEKLRF